MRRLLLSLAIAAGLIQPAFAHQFPAKPITIIVPYGPGGGTDQFARVLANTLGQKLGGAVVVENTPGAGGTIGLQKMNNAPNDGHTLIVATGMEYEMANLVKPDMPSRITEVKPIGNFGTQPMILVARPGLGVKTVEEFIALAKSKPGAVSIAAVGPGTALQITGLMIQQAASINLIDVNYKGSGQIVTDILSNNVDAALMSLPTVMGLITDGELVPLGVSESTRFPTLPNVPSLSETPALKGLNTYIAYPLLGPKNMPQSAVAAIAKASTEALADPQFQQQMSKLMVVPSKRVAGEDADYIKSSQFAAFKKALSTAKPKQ
jgi:tripartite-type tricarboxylate transporter receptor subunit TctC